MHDQDGGGATEAFSTTCAVHIEDSLVVVRLSWLSGRAMAGQARGVLGSTPGGCRCHRKSDPGPLRSGRIGSASGINPPDRIR